MKRKAFRLVVILATISITGIVAIQIFWIRKAFDLGEKQFTHNVNIALLNSVSTLCELNGNAISPDPIEQLSTNYFIVNLNNRISPDILESVLKSEFVKREIASDFEYGIFDCANEVMVYGNYVSLENNDRKASQVKFPVLAKDAYYFGVLFPNKSEDIVGQMWIWIFSSSILVIVVVFFGYTLFVILRQKQLSEIQADFINNMTHEFRTPISTISLSSEVLKSADILKTPDRLHNYANIINLEATRLQTQVDRVLQIASLDDGDVQLSKEKTDIHSLMVTASENLRLAISKKNGKIIFEELASECEIFVDRLHFTNIIYNLLDNALKYSHDAPLIVLRTKNTDNGIQVTIEDNGQGMTKEQLNLIFMKFYRVPEGNLHNVKGFGLGLYYVRLIVEAHNGSIQVKSEPEKGTTFIITLPIQ